MCDSLLQRISLRNIGAVGQSDDEFFSGITSLQYFNIFEEWPVGLPTKNGFAPSSTKMSKDANVLVFGVRQQQKFALPTNRRGIHIYLRKACEATSNKCSGVSLPFNNWSHHQSIIRNAKGDLLQVDEVEVSKIGHSIVALDAVLPQIYVFEQTNLCAPAVTRWTLQQTLRFTATDGFLWNKIALNDEHTRMLVRKRNASLVYKFCMFSRARAQQKSKFATQSADGYVFGASQELVVPSDLTLVGNSALSHDGETVLLVASDSSDSVHVLQYDYNCDAQRHLLVANFPLHSSASTVLDIKFGGACSERLYILTKTSPSTISYEVEVYSRVPGASSSTCLTKTTPRASCCGALTHFGVDTRIDVVNDVLYDSPDINSDWTHSLLTEAIDGDLFVVVSIINDFRQDVCTYTIPSDKLENPAIFARLWRQAAASKTVQWCSCNLSDSVNFARNLRYDVHSFDMLSFDNACQQYYFPFTQRNVAIGAPYFVNNPDGCFYFCVFAGGGVPIEFFYYYRVHGDADYTVFDESVAAIFGKLECDNNDYAGVPIALNDKTCNAKELDVILVQKSGATTPPPAWVVLMNPSMIFEKTTIPLRLCVAVVGFGKKI